MATPEADWQHARDWLWRQRSRAPANADVWDLRWRWQTRDEGGRLYRQVTAGRYRLSPMDIVGRGEDARAQWSAADALVLKWVALQGNTHAGHRHPARLCTQPPYRGGAAAPH